MIGDGSESNVGAVRERKNNIQMFFVAHLNNFRQINVYFVLRVAKWTLSV